MKCRKMELFPALLLAVLVVGLNCWITTAYKGVSDVDDQRAQYIALEKALWKYLNQNQTGDTELQLKKVYDSHRKFIAETLKRNFGAGEGEHYILNHFYEWSLLEKSLLGVEGLFDYFKTFLDKYKDGNYDQRAALDFTETVFKDHHLAVPGIFQTIQNVMIKQSLYYRIMLEAREQVCVTQQSAQQFLYSLYSDITFTELKGYTMMQFSWMILRIYELGNFTHEAEIMHESFNERLMETQALLREAMRRADRIVWRCDPDLFIKGESYDEVTRLLQGYVENEVDMNPDGTCRENCGHYSIAKNHGCFKDLYCSKQPKCTGQLLWCQYVDSDMWICPATAKSERRYEWIEYEDGRILGTKQNCPRGTTKVDSWWRWLFWHCSYCFCLCDEQGIKSDRYFNLRETVSDIDHNMVVTGIRFVKVNRIFHLQIQEGKLERNGIINPNTIHWKPVDDYRIYDRDVENDRDYHTLGWDRRAIDLDDLVGNITGQVVTGVRFRVLGAHLNLEVRLTEIDFAEGRLINPHATSVWFSNDNTVYSGDKRQKLMLKSPHISTKSYLKSTFNSKHNQYIDFTNTDMDKDAAQTTVPFIDIQDVVSHPAVPLSGIGIYHKGRDGYGGFIAPRIMTFDFSPYIRIPDVRKRK